MRRFISFREHHEAWVRAWMAREPAELRPLQRIALFDQAFAVLWQRACTTLGELTLVAAAERALGEAVKTFPQLAVLSLETAGLSFRKLRENGGATRDPDLTEALRLLLVELLTVLGSLTSEALTPSLHRDLAKCAPARDGDRALSETQSQG